MSARKTILALAVLACFNMLLAMDQGAMGQGQGTPAAPPDTISNSKPRFSVRKTGTEDTKSLRKKTADMKDPDNLKTEVIYDDKDNTYTIGTSFTGSDDTSGRGQGTSRNTNASRGGGTRNQNTSNQASTTGAAGATSGSILPGRAGLTLGTATSFLNAPVLMTP